MVTCLQYIHSKVFQISYCQYYSPIKRAEWEAICQEFVRSIYQVFPSFTSKPKIHLILHLVECMEEFGPTAAFNTERYAHVDTDYYM